MPKFNHKNLLYFEKQIIVYVNGVRQRLNDVTSTQTPSASATDDK